MLSDPAFDPYDDQYMEPHRPPEADLDDEPYTTIEYPSAGATYSEDRHGVYRYDTYSDGSVLAGQERRSFVASYDTAEEAKAAHPEAEESGCQYRPPFIPATPPPWFDPAAAGESWDGE